MSLGREWAEATGVSNSRRFSPVIHEGGSDLTDKRVKLKTATSVKAFQTLVDGARPKETASLYLPPEDEKPIKPTRVKVYVSPPPPDLSPTILYSICPFPSFPF